MKTEADFMSDSFSTAMIWLELSKKYKIRLPLWRMACTTGGMRRYLKKLGVSVDDYLKANNEKNLRQFRDMNPDWPLRAWVGIQLEWKDYNERGPYIPPVQEPIKKRRSKVTEAAA